MVLILVVMDDALVLYFRAQVVQNCVEVLILVVMDDALVLAREPVHRHHVCVS